MIKKTIKYEDYNGEKKENDYYFHMNPAELTELELSTPGGLEATIKRLMDEKDGKEIVAIFKKLIFDSYGEKTPDGRFEKSPELSRKFASTGAYPVLFMELATDADAAAAFVNGMIGADQQMSVTPA